MTTLPPLRLLALVVCVACVAACGPAPLPGTPAPPTPAAPAGPEGVSSARWLYRHVESLASVTSRDLPGGRGTLHVSAAGERWITIEGPAPAADGGAVAPTFDTAPMILPEPVAGVLPVGPRWAFFGVSGRAFLAASPLGALDEVRPPPAPLRTVGVGNAVALALTMDGDLLRTTDGGAHWIPVKPAGLAPAVPYALAMRADGAGVVLAAPQRAISTTDDGAGWAPLAVPAGGPHVLVVSEQGTIWLADEGDRPERTHRLEGKPLAFVAATPPPIVVRKPDDGDAALYEEDRDTQRALAGRRVLAVGRPASRHVWKVQISELDREGPWKIVPELNGCEGSRVAAAAFGHELVLGCVRRRPSDVNHSAAADAGAPPAHRMMLYRSKDNGASWAEDGEVPLWDSWVRILAGPDGWLLVQRTCGRSASGCTPLAFRTGAGQPFTSLETAPDTDYDLFAIDAGRRKLLAVSSHGKPTSARFHNWSLTGKPGLTTKLFPTPSGVRGAITVDDHGAILVVAASTGRWTVLRSADEGASFEFDDFAPEMRIHDVALAGDRGLLASPDGHFWETASSGKKWVPVTGLPRRSVAAMRCDREGCAVGPDLRLGWDLAGDEAAAPAVAAPLETRAVSEVPGATPIRCVTAGTRPIPRTLVGNFAELTVMAPVSGRLVVPVASAGSGVDLVVLSATEKGLAAGVTSLLGAAPNRAATGSRTEVMTTSAGVVATRATYPVSRDRGVDVWISPVSAEVAWWRPQSGKVNRARLPPIGKGHMSGTFTLERRSPEKGEILALTADALVYRPDFQARHLVTLADKGPPVKVDSGVLAYGSTAVPTPAGLALLEIMTPETGAGAVRFAFAHDEETHPPALWTLAPPSSAPAILSMARGAGGALVVTWSGPPDGPPHGFVIPVRPGVDPPEVIDLRLADLLVERPRACGETQDPGAVRVQVKLPRRARRPVLVAGADGPQLLLAESAVVVVPPTGEPCVSAWIAVGDAHYDLTIIPVATPGGWAVSAVEPRVEEGRTTRDLVVTALRCGEAAGLEIPAAFGWKGF